MKSTAPAAAGASHEGSFHVSCRSRRRRRDAAAEPPPEVLERIEASRPGPPQLDELAARLDKIETRLARPSARVEVREDQAQLETKAFLSFCRRASTA